MTFRQQIRWVLLGSAVAAFLLVPSLIASVWPSRHQVAAFACQRMDVLLSSPASEPPPAPPGAQSTGTPGATPGASSPAASARASEELTFPLVYKQRATPTFTASPTLTPTPTRTKRPTPTPTPTLPWPPALDRPGPSKLGLHVQWNNSSEIMEFVRYMKPAVVKAVGDFGFLEELKQVSPLTVIVARTDARVPFEGDPVAAARGYVMGDLETYRAHPAVDYWEGINEPGVRGHMAWYAAFEAERTRFMAELGLKTAVGSFSAGAPEWEDFGAFLPAIEAAAKYGGIFTVHEYDAPTMDRSIGAGLPGHPNYPDRGALALRYRWWYDDFLKPRGLVVPLVVSEAGVDGGVSNRPGPRGRGWQDFVRYWVDQGLAKDGLRAYLNQLQAYDAELRKDDYVIGFAVFTAGAMNDDWRSYDITPILRHIATYIVAEAAATR